MKRILFVLFACVSFVMTSCNRDLKNSEEFVGTYNGSYAMTGSTTVDIPILGPYTVPMNETGFNRFFITLGQADNEVIINGFDFLDEGQSLVGIVKGNDITFEDSMTVVDEGAIMTITISGNGKLVDDELSYTIDVDGSGTVSYEGISVNAILDLQVTGLAEQD